MPNEKDNKGKKGGRCNRGACQTGLPATHYNKSTREYYCKVCARKINKANGEILCVED